MRAGGLRSGGLRAGGLRSGGLLVGGWQTGGLQACWLTKFCLRFVFGLFLNLSLCCGLVEYLDFGVLCILSSLFSSHLFLTPLT